MSPGIPTDETDATAYPLAWPRGVVRTPTSKRQKSSFHRTLRFPPVLASMLNELRLMGATSVVVSTNIPVKSNGSPYLRGHDEVDDPGVAVYWWLVKEGKSSPYVMACDQWDRLQCNLHSIELTIKSLRGIERWGATRSLSQAFEGFKALPSRSGEGVHWRSFLGDCSSIDEIKEAYRKKARDLHPDQGGSDEAMSLLNRAKDEALRELAIGG